MARGYRLLDRIADEMDISGEPIPGEVILELTSDRRVLIENHMGIIQYCSDKICIKVKFGHIAVCGSNLELSQMTRDQLVITGSVNTIGILRRNG